jgi:protein-S-isoprenylcysteine O-methyltransferase Ste14
VEQGQHVISTGPYRLVRHPMYSGAVLMWLAAAPALGSWVALPFCALLLPVMALRLLNEEKVLQKKLLGYTEYCEKTRHHLIPYVW